VPLTEREKEWAGRVSRFLKAELKRAGVSYKELARRLNEHGLQETEDSITSKLGRGTFAVTFFFATLAALGLEGVRLEDL
jgi:urease accessory protein UreF